MNAANPLPENQQLDGLSAELDAKSGLDASTDSDLGTLGAELETLASQLALPLPPERYLQESACARAVELACRIGDETPAEPSKAQSKTPESSELKGVGAYQFLELIGEGGMGAVYKALHPRLDKVVAIKVLSQGRLKRRDSLNRFEREMKAVGKLDHPHLVRALDAGDADGLHYLVMEYVAGTDLSDLVKLKGPLPIAEACELVVQAATGLHAAHSRGMVHRDIKPANLMLARQEFGPPIVKVLDLGLALLADAEAEEAGTGLTSDGQIMGTIDYMAPEQANNSHSVDIRADIYSLGTTLYALLTGGSVFQGRPHKSVMQKLVALSTESTPPIRDRRPDVSAGLSDVIHRMLAKDPKDRFATPADVITALKPFAVGADLSSLLDEQQGAAGAIVVLDPQAKANDATELLTIRLPSTSDAHPKLAEAAESQGPRSRRRGTLIAALLGGVALLGVILFSIRTQNGDVIVEIPEDLPADVKKEIKITVTGNGVTEVASAANGWKVGIAEGKYNVELTGGGDQVQMEDKKVTVSRNKKAIVTITTKPREAMAAKPTDPDRSATEWLRSIGSGGEIGVMIDGTFHWVRDNEPLPAKPFLVRKVTFSGPGIEQLGDRLADEVANRMKGVRINLDVTVYSQTLTTAGFGKLIRLPEFAEAIGVQLDCSGLGDGIFQHLAQLPNMGRIELTASPTTGSPDLTGKGMSALKACPKLAEITWINGSPSAQGIEELSQVPQLNSLRFNAITGTEQQTIALAKLSLRDLKLHASKVDDAMVRHLAAMANLETLDISHNPITDKGLAELQAIRTLKILNLQGTKVTAAGVADLQKTLPSCKIESSLAIADPVAERRVAEWVLSKKGVVTVRLQGEPQDVKRPEELPQAPFTVAGVLLPVGANIHADEIANADLQRLAGLSHLETLDLGRQPITGEGLAQLSGRTELKSLMLYSGGVGVDGIPTVAKFTNLEQFMFQSEQCDAWAEAVSRLPMLRDVTVYRGDITDAGVALLARLPKLEKLRLSDCGNLTDASLKTLAACKSLKSLVLGYPQVPSPAIRALQQALPECQIVNEYLGEDANYILANWLRAYDPQLTWGGNFSDNLPFEVVPGRPIPAEPFRMGYVNLFGKKCEEQGDAYLEELAGHLQRTRLKGLMLSGRSFTSAGMVKLLCHPELADLTSLTFHNEAVDDDVLAAVSKLKTLSKLVSETGPKLTSKGIGQLRELTELTGLTLLGCPGLSAEALEQLQPLTKLDYLQTGGPRYTDRHFTAITKFKNLKTLLTYDGGIDDAMAARFVEMPSLKTLALTRNPITDKGLQELKKLDGLTLLHLFDTKVTAAGVADLQRALPKCKIEWDPPAGDAD